MATNHMTPKPARPSQDPAPTKPVIVCTPVVRNDPMTIVVIGAGGTGARVIPPIVQMLRRQDRLVIVDHDTVEDRNLARQHFAERDIGQPKALILAQRYRHQHLTPTALVTQITQENIAPILQSIEHPTPSSSLVVIGCVDNNVARGVINTIFTGVTLWPIAAYIDVGNERRGGQMLVTLRNWPLIVGALGSPAAAVTGISMYTMSDAMPQLCRPAAWMCDGCSTNNEASQTVCQACGRAPGTCGNRIDMQTVMVNHMAAGMVINALSWLTLGIPFSMAGAFFSTLNSIQPIPIVGINISDRRLLVDTQFAAV